MKFVKCFAVSVVLTLACITLASAQDLGWPRKITTPQGTLIYYPPQVDNWANTKPGEDFKGYPQPTSRSFEH